MEEVIMTTSNINKTTQVTRDQQMIAGIEKHLNTVPSLIVAGKTYTPAQAVAVLQARIDAANAVSAAKATYVNLVQTQRTEAAQTKQFAAALRQAVYIMFSAAVDTLADFGISPHKTRASATVGIKAITVAKNLATRAARHTMGKVQKAKIHGVVPVATPGPSPAAPPAAPLAPASAATAQAASNGGHASTGSPGPKVSPPGSPPDVQPARDAANTGTL
jgi:hypothetical protein